MSVDPARILVRLSVAPSTAKKYDSVEAPRLWKQFRDQQNYRGLSSNPFLLDLDTFHRRLYVIHFMHFLDNHLKKSCSSLSTIMAALRFYFKCELQDFSIFGDETVLSARKGIKPRGRESNIMMLEGLKMALTPDLVKRVEELSQRGWTSVKHMIALATTTAYHFGFRVGECVISAGSRAHCLLREDCTFETKEGTFFFPWQAHSYKISDVFSLVLYLRSRKADQTGGGDVQILSHFSPESSSLLNKLFRWCQDYPGLPTDLLFSRPYGRGRANVSGSQVSKAIKAAAESMGLPGSSFSAKSARIGAGTAYSASGANQLTTMRKLGHVSTRASIMYQRSTIHDGGSLDLPPLLTVQDSRRILAVKPSTRLN